MVVDDTVPRALPSAVDTVIIGAGCAGLALASRLADQGYARSVLVLDARHDYRDDRTWSFWSPSEHRLSGIVTQAWPSWRFGAGSSAARGAAAAADHSVPGLSYQAIRAIDYYRDAQARIAASAHVSLRLGVTVADVEAARPPALGTIGDVSSRALVHTSAGTVAARHVVDTRPESTRATLFQCFVGVEVVHGGALHAAPSVVESSRAGLMTRMRSDDAGFVFTYVLPLTPTTALIELTRFSVEPLPLDRLARELDDELAALGLSDAVVVRDESGVLPMGADPAPESSIPGVVRAGNGGGALRAATGYAFSRIHDWAEAACASMLAGGAPLPHPPEPWVQRQMDRIFLQTLRAHPERTPEFFLRLAQRVAPARLTRFLTDRARASDLVAIILALPFGPFLAQIPDRTGVLDRRELRVRAPRVAAPTRVPRDASVEREPAA
ncbi:MAG TPA: lycopene cyclase family protein [Microcella sp.]|nr:lycopene cyclase family protein [Microcella sp.]